MTERTWKRLWAAWYRLDLAIDAVRTARPHELTKATAALAATRRRMNKAMAVAALDPHETVASRLRKPR